MELDLNRTEEQFESDGKDYSAEMDIAKETNLIGSPIKLGPGQGDPINLEFNNFK